MAGTTANAWKEFTLTTPFSYAGGTNNLLVLVETNYGGAGTGTSAGPACRYTTATSKHMYIRADNSAPTGTCTVNGNRPNIKINITTASQVIDIDLGGTAENTVPDLIVYPNPAKNIVTVENIGNAKTIELYTMAGLRVYTQKIESDNNFAEIDLSNLSVGTYILRVNDGVKPRQVKIIKQ